MSSLVIIHVSFIPKHQDKCTCILPVWKPYILQFQSLPSDVTLEGPQMNKFEQVPSDHYMMSLAGGAPQVWCPERRGTLPDLFQGVPAWPFPNGVPYQEAYPWCIWCYLPSPLWTDRCLWKHYLPQLHLQAVKMPTLPTLGTVLRENLIVSVENTGGDQ